MPSFRVCPDCKERLDQDARQCVCGWKPKGFTSDPHHWRCAVTSGGDRCRYPGSVSMDIGLNARFVCPFHFSGGSDAIHSARIVQSSFDWDGQPDSYLRLRHKFASRADHHPAGQVEEGGAIQPRARELPAHIRDLVQGLRIRAK